MPVIDLGNGSRAFICIRGRQRNKPCSVCSRPGDKLCDFPLGGGKTCDKSLCNRCAVHTHPNTDVCPSHPKKLAL